jgi:hypothetical protein
LLENSIFRTYILFKGGRNMTINKPIVVLGLFLALSFFVPCQGWSQLFPYEGGTQPKPGTHAPIITHAFAVEKGYYGYIWKIYIEAEDPDGDMLRIASVVDQVGYGHYPTDWIYLRPQYRNHFKGYLQWNTFSSNAPYMREWTQLTLKVSVFDKAGNESNVVVFPFEFVSGVKDQYRYQLPAPFDQGNLPRLGYISIDLFDPTYMGPGRDGWD